MFTFGSDPEFMLKDAKGNLRCAIGVVKGTKSDRLHMGDEDFAYYDNVLAECSITPGESKDEVVKNFQRCFKRYAALVNPLRLTPQASATYPKSECTHEDAFVFGCDPEFDAYNMCIIAPPESNNLFRSAGGHIHIGFDGGADQHTGSQLDDEINFAVSWNRLWVVRMADILIGIPSLFLDIDPTSKERRKLYGGAGTHRGCEKYGVEYRPLSNFWLSSPKLVELMYDLAQNTVKIVMEDRSHEKIWDNLSPEDLQSTINTCNMKKAKKYLEASKSLMSEANVKQFDSALKFAESGKKFDMYKEWGIK